MKLSVYDEKKGSNFLWKLFRFSFSFTWLIILWQTSTYSQTADVSENPERTSQDIAYLDYLLELTISSGSFLELNLEKTPASITVISREMIKISGARNITELLEIYVPGFQYMFNKWNGTLWFTVSE